MHLRRRLIAAAALVPLVVLGPAATAAPTPESPEKTTWGMAPATDGVPDERVSFRVELEPGQSHEDELAVVNHSDRAVTFAITASDGVITEDGTFDLLTGARPTGAGAWIEHAEEVRVEAGGIAVVPWTLTVPRDALPGDHPGGLLASVASTPGDPAAVGLDAGVGTRIHLRIAGEVAPSIAITDVETSYDGTWHPLKPGILHVAWTVRNDGNVRLGASELLEVSGLLGLDPGVVTQEVGRQREVLPGQSASVSTAVEAWPLGVLTTRLSATTSVVGADAIEATLPTALVSTTTTAVPWSQIAVLVLVLGVLFVGIWRGRRRRRARARVSSPNVNAEHLVRS